jgi:hypothetical protein
MNMHAYVLLTVYINSYVKETVYKQFSLFTTTNFFGDLITVLFMCSRFKPNHKTEGLRGSSKNTTVSKFYIFFVSFYLKKCMLPPNCGKQHPLVFRANC